MGSHRCPHRATGRIAWPSKWPPPSRPCASVDVCDLDTCHTAAYAMVEQVTGHQGEYIAYPPKTQQKRPARNMPTGPKRQRDRAAAVTVPWEVLGALLATASTAVEEWAEQQIGADVVTQAIDATPQRFQTLTA